MGKYANHEEFGVNAPINYREDTTSESFLKGMSAIAPPGMKPKTIRGQKFEEKTDFKASATWHRNFDHGHVWWLGYRLFRLRATQRAWKVRLGEIKRKPGR